MDAKEKKALAECLLREARDAHEDDFSYTVHACDDLAVVIEALAQYIDNLEGVK